VGQVFSVFIIAVAAGEAAIGLAIVIALMRSRDSINVDEINLMRG
jgi:NADH-quinone oxidoreductase subunit K